MSGHSNFPFQYIDHQEALRNAVESLEHKKQLSVDLEFDKNRFRYGFNLCLIQIFDGEQTFLIDPITEHIDLSAIFKVFENPDIQKIVFSFGEDLRLLHSLGCFPKNLYDLQMASSLLNFPPSSLASLLDQILELQISKSSQQSNWYQRPLTQQQIDYAIHDVIHLPNLYEKFCHSAIERGVKDWIEQENKYFETSNYEEASQNEILKERYKADLTEAEWHIFSKLMHLRDQHAKSINRPPFYVCERQTITQISKNTKFSKEWMNIASNHRSTKNSEFLNNLERVINYSLEEIEHLGLSRKKRALKKPSKEEYEKWRAIEQRVKFAKVHHFKPIQKCIANEYGINTQVFILNNRLIKELVEGNNSNLLPYKKKLILKCADSIHIDLSKYQLREPNP